MPMDGERRREFLRSCGRAVVGGGLAALGATVLFRNTSADPHRCTNMGICCSCQAFAGCILPQAMSAKKHQKKEPDNG